MTVGPLDIDSGRSSVSVPDAGPGGDLHLRHCHPPAKGPSLQQPAEPPSPRNVPSPKIRNQTKPTQIRLPPVFPTELLGSSRPTRFVGNPSAGSPRRLRRPRKWRTPWRGCRTTSSSRATTRSRASTTPPSSSSTAPSPRSTSELPLVPRPRRPGCALYPLDSIGIRLLLRSVGVDRDV
jgi:hypothetical protein